MQKRHIRMISAAVAVAIPLGAAVCGAVAVPPAQAQTITVSASGIKPDATTPVVGVNLYIKDNYSLADTTAWGERDLKFIRDTLGLKAVAIDWDYNVPSDGADVVETSPTRTPTIADLTELTKIAESYGLRVEYRALFAIDNSDSRTRSIVPAHLGAWLDSLLSTETPALKLADDEGVSEFVLGTEMASVDQSPLWDDFFKKAAEIYKGSLSYASWGGRSDTDSGGFFDTHRVELPTADLGATAYPPIDLPSDASVDALTKAWEHFLTAYTPDSVLRRTAIDEIGIPALAGSVLRPVAVGRPHGHSRPDHPGPLVPGRVRRGDRGAHARDLLLVRAPERQSGQALRFARRLPRATGVPGRDHVLLTSSATA